MRIFQQFHNVRISLIVFVFLPFLLVIVLSAWFGLGNLERDLHAEMEEDIELIARSVRLPLGYALERGDRDFLEQLLLSTDDINRVYGIYVYDKQGNRVARSGARKALVEIDTAADLASTGDQKSGFGDAEGEAMFSYFVPLVDSTGEINGLLQVSRRGREFVEHLTDFRYQVLAVVAASGILLITAIYFGYYFALGRHLQSVQKSMEAIAIGGRNLRIKPRGPQEVRALADCVNSMLDGIAISDKALSRQRHTEFELKARLQQNEKLAAIGRLAAGVAHELGTPLSVADGKAQRALRTAEGAQAQALESIRQQLSRMTRIIRQLMEFARPAAPDYRRFTVGGVVQSAIAQVEHLRDQAAVAIDLLSTSPEIAIEADRMRLEQALVNLLRNAIQASPGGRVQIGWFYTDGHQNVSITIDDDGPGITPSLEGRLLEPFVTDKSGQDGIGLGLAVVSSVAVEHDGNIEFGDSAMGGARFVLTLPTQKPEGIDEHE